MVFVLEIIDAGMDIELVGRRKINRGLVQFTEGLSTFHNFTQLIVLLKCFHLSTTYH
jgi:hypothetical protein